MKKKKWIIVSIIVSVVVLAGVNVYALTKSQSTVSQKQETKTITVEKKAISDSIIASGIVVAADEEVLTIDPTKGLVSNIYVSVGQKVSPGTPLFKYKSSELEAELNAIQNVEQRATAQQNELKKRLSDVDKNLSAAKAKKVEPQPQLQPQEGETEEEKQAKQQAQLQAQQQGQKEAIEMLNKERQAILAEMKAGEFDRKDTQLRKQNVQKRIGELSIKSSISGTVTEVNKVASLKDGSSQVVVRILSSSPFKIEGTVTEYDLVRIAPGQSVNVKAKVYPDREWKGKIEKVSQTPESSPAAAMMGGGGGQENITSYPYTVVLDNSTDLVVGFHVNIEIQTTGKTALVLPFEAIRKIDGKEYVWVVNGTAQEKREVKTGISNDTYKEIVSGVEEGDQVLATPPAEGIPGLGVNP